MAKTGMLTRQKRRMRKLQEEGPTHEFEVRCGNCDVSYPPGTKKCMYCGARPGAQPLFTPSHHPDPLESYMPSGDSFQTTESDRSTTRTSPGPFDDDDTEEMPDSPRGMLLRMLGSLSWVILFIAITVYRACTG